MGLVARATQHIESERVQKLEAEQKAKLAAQDAEQQVSFMNAMNAEVAALTEFKDRCMPQWIKDYLHSHGDDFSPQVFLALTRGLFSLPC